MKPRKDIRFEMLLDPESDKKLEKLAHEANKSQAAIVRDLINQAATVKILAGNNGKPHVTGGNV